MQMRKLLQIKIVGLLLRVSSVENRALILGNTSLYTSCKQKMLACDYCGWVTCVVCRLLICGLHFGSNIKTLKFRSMPVLEAGLNSCFTDSFLKGLIQSNKPDDGV